MRGRVLEWEFVRARERVRLSRWHCCERLRRSCRSGCDRTRDHQIANYLAKPYLDSGQLTQVLAQWTADRLPIWVLYPRSRHLPAKVRLFVEWVSELTAMIHCCSQNFPRRFSAIGECPGPFERASTPR